MKHRRGARRHNQPAIRRTREGRDSALDFVGVAQADRGYLHPKRRRHGLDGGKLIGSGALAGISKDRCSHHAWRDLFEQLQPFPGHAVF
jgi:hypothetical protein